MIYSFETPQPVVARIALGVKAELNKNCKIKVKMHFYVIELDTLLQQSYSHGRADGGLLDGETFLNKFVFVQVDSLSIFKSYMPSQRYVLTCPPKSLLQVS